MRSLVSIQRFLVRKLKSVPRQQWVQRPQDAFIPFLQRKVQTVQIKYHQDVKKQQKKQQAAAQQQYKPCSPKMGPYLVHNPKISNKMYRWCSCGQSLNQPFCDDSHQGTKFKPYKFTIQQNVKNVNLCGCKLTTNKPFCDNQSCKKKQNN